LQGLAIVVLQGRPCDSRVGCEVTKKGHLQERDERTIGLLLVHIRPNLKLKLLRSLTSKDSTDLVPPAYMVPMDQSAFCGAHIVYHIEVEQSLHNVNRWSGGGGVLEDYLFYTRELCPHWSRLLHHTYYLQSQFAVTLRMMEV
jgi:hypothetical protein